MNNVNFSERIVSKIIADYDNNSNKSLENTLFEVYNGRKYVRKRRITIKGIMELEKYINKYTCISNFQRKIMYECFRLGDIANINDIRIYVIK